MGGTPLAATDPLGLCSPSPCSDPVVGVTSTYQEVPTISAPIPTSLPMPTSAGLSNQLAMFIADSMSAQPSKADQGYCVTRNIPLNAGWRSPNGDLNRDAEAVDGPYDPGPTGDNCPTSRSGGGTYGPSIGPAQTVPLPPPGGVITPATAPTATHCATAALEKNGVALALDAASLGVDAFGPEAQYAKLGAGLTVSTAATINSAAHQDVPGASLGMASYLRAATELAATNAGWSWAKWVPGAGLVMDGYSAYRDASQAYIDFSSCMAGR